MRKKRYFSPEFKADAVEQTLLEGNTISSVAKELGLGNSTLFAWVKKYQDANKVQDVHYGPKDAMRLKELERKNNRLQQENDFLKKAAAFFAKEHPELKNMN